MGGSQNGVRQNIALTTQSCPVLNLSCKTRPDMDKGGSRQFPLLEVVEKEEKEIQKESVRGENYICSDVDSFENK